MLPGETVATGASPYCYHCDRDATGPQVLSSAAGYFVGYVCQCGPAFTRESRYYRMRGDADGALERGDWAR